MNIIGAHVIGEISNARFERLNDVTGLKTIMLESFNLSRATYLNSLTHRFTPQGVTILVMLAESHCSIHTYPEFNYAAVDYFTCGELCDPETAVEFIAKKLDGDLLIQIIQRGYEQKTPSKASP